MSAAEDRLARIEGLLIQVLGEVRGKKRKSRKRQKTVADRAAARVESEPEKYQPNDLQKARARRALLRYRG